MWGETVEYLREKKEPGQIVRGGVGAEEKRDGFEGEER